ncbi:hypothetical protein BX661DRAFT_186232 [Kickxella alabastrina]|uniref:uncharacterized protein n=1 Tax=Kickxella alabastrina TaxID=61397 RepID=UPI00221FB837|nr:uncharacterized protein BX661DRAFT_186232 [Kickxella alabastrina]KAI7823684.1 hypothetical protein BX661DRAFT_186232 [Kickxella alabastrina]
MVLEKGACTLDDLSVYFKQYQVESYERHLRYNRAVWRRNLAMVVPGVRAWWAEVRRREWRRGEAVARHSAQPGLDAREDGVGMMGGVDAPVERCKKTGGVVTGPGPASSSAAESAADSAAAAAAADRGVVDRRAEKIKSYY